MTAWATPLNTEFDEEDHFSDEETTDSYDNNKDDEEYSFCSTCHQEYEGSCPINSSECPNTYEEDDEDSDDDSDFDDIDDIDSLIGVDEEAERLIDEDEDIPPEDLVDDEDEEEEEEEEEIVTEVEQEEGYDEFADL